MAWTRPTGYEEIDDSELNAGQPIRQTLAYRWRDSWYSSLCIEDSGNQPTDVKVRCPERIKHSGSGANTGKFLQAQAGGDFALADTPAFENFTLSSTTVVSNSISINVGDSNFEYLLRVVAGNPVDERTFIGEARWTGSSFAHQFSTLTTNTSVSTSTTSFTHSGNTFTCSFFGLGVPADVEAIMTTLRTRA